MSSVHPVSKVMMPKMLSISEDSEENGTGDDEPVQPFSNAPDIILQPGSLMGTFSKNKSMSWQSKKFQADNDECFHRAIAPILGAAQFFGILPVSGIMNQSLEKMTFKMKSLRGFYTLLLIILFSIVTLACFVRIIEHMSSFRNCPCGRVPRAFMSTLFYGNSIIGIVTFLWLSPRWIKLQHMWKTMEKQSNRFDRGHLRLRYKFNTISLILMCFAVVEHILYIINTSISQSAPDLLLWTWKKYFEATFSQSENSYNNILGNEKFTKKVMFIIDTFSAIIWNFTDLFLMLVSTGLAQRYKFLNKATANFVPQKRHALFWLHLRQKYTVLNNLVIETDRCISPLILFSFANNLSYICLHLFVGFLPRKDGNLDTIFTFSTVTFVIARTIAVTLLAARIHDLSKNALSTIYQCPTSCFTIEAERLQHQLTANDVALSGMKFFFVTRNFMLAIVGVIITYEIVLLQLNAKIKD